MLALKKALTVIALTVALVAVSPVAHAQAQGGFWESIVSGWDSVVEVIEQAGQWLQDKIVEIKETHGGGPGRAVPELDPSSAGSAALLLLGGVAYIAARRREDDAGE